MRQVKIGMVTLDARRPKLGVVLAGHTRDQLMGQAAQVLTSAAQIVEWRLDQYVELDNRAELVNTAAQLRQLLGTVPIIATLKPQVVTPETYYQVYVTLANNRAVDALNLDLTMVNDAGFMPLTQQMRQQQVPLILSQTYDQALPTVKDLVADYQALAAEGADVAQLTVRTTSELETLTLMTATAKAREQLTLPLIATVMGPFGQYAAVSGQLMGSSVIFGAVGQITAPGQLTVSQLKQSLQVLTPLTEASHAF
ncbi:type I 3-dehydroquinate dehydratase [Lactobacillus sp.] [Lactiplantibacillus mudanjiangensis]|uniref:type I 3-dehydroquinate dehydratase n=1 Tax=Lactiplantibacillus mudanjiangensis TaxID=1296538 RepID=UPI0010145737|nr:type I 3-dehydroquinate dehydratase [Lactobacillus sp.] [Lactiplantibacillus mudanjiangensis]